jgi:tRNA pseudouridine38-40 synthase
VRIGMVLEYDGTDYHGWQIQPDRPTVQGVLEGALATILGERVRLDAAGRTDAGVHARGQVAAFSTGRPVDCAKLQRGLNALCGPEIVAQRVGLVGDDFDPRRDARSRLYEYRIRNAPWTSPFTRRHSWHVHRVLDRSVMQRAAAALVGEHDFSSFQAADCDAENPTRQVFESSWETVGEDLVFRIEATAFLRHMVRNMVGTLVEVGSRERTVEDFLDVLAARDRTRAGVTAPPHGLCLVKVAYDTLFAASAS